MRVYQGQLLHLAPAHGRQLRRHSNNIGSLSCKLPLHQNIIGKKEKKNPTKSLLTIRDVLNSSILAYKHRFFAISDHEWPSILFYGENTSWKTLVSATPASCTAQSLCTKLLFLGSKAKDRPPKNSYEMLKTKL